MNWVLSHREWVVFITVTVLLSLLMTVAELCAKVGDGMKG
jgi:hypothetical protein